jgi:hydrogenase-4 component B
MSLTRTLPWVAVAMLVVVIPAGLMRRSKRVTATWACGLPALDSRMQYTATAISKPLRKVFARVYQPERNLEVLPPGELYFPKAMSYSSVRTTSFERSLYRPAVDAIVAAAHRLRQLQTGNIQYYLLYMFVALVTLLVLMRFA